MDTREPRIAHDLWTGGWPVRRADLLAVCGAARRRAENGASTTPRLRMLELHYYPGNASLTPHVLLEELPTP